MYLVTIMSEEVQGIAHQQLSLSNNDKGKNSLVRSHVAIAPNWEDHRIKSS